MYHSITIGSLSREINGWHDDVDHSYVDGKNTWDDWHLIPSSRPLVTPPKPNTKTIQIPGRNGVLDLSTILTGNMTYQNRTGSWEFVIVNDLLQVDGRNYDPLNWDWATAYSTIMAYLHGKNMVCMFEDDLEFYYEGRLSVNTLKSDKNWSTIVIDYDLYPYKRTVQSSEELWLWDPFNFETGVIRNYSYTLSPDDIKRIDMYGYSEPVMPLISANKTGVLLVFGEEHISLQNETRTYDEIVFNPGINPITLINNSDSRVEVKFLYRGGEF